MFCSTQHYELPTTGPHARVFLAKQRSRSLVKEYSTGT
jgi:hypothetical protein